ncbi:porphobilinogen deaminase [Tulasnella sp. 419]|nr:porphobilinogen deaminase [Tulasnella sp. 419]
MQSAVNQCVVADVPKNVSVESGHTPPIPGNSHYHLPFFRLTPSETHTITNLTSLNHNTMTEPTDPIMSSRTFVIGSRASKLAVIQAEIVRSTLIEHFPSHTFTLNLMTTEGDKNQSQALYLLGGKALWTKELEVGLLEKEIDLIVHSLKDVPTALPEGCELGAIMEREDPCDCLVMKEGLTHQTLDELPEGSVIGTSSVRRVAQLRRLYPKLKFADVRGNLNTRLAKLDDPNGQYAALILARAGLVRLGFGSRITGDLKSPTLYHAVGQGALAIEIRKGDEITKSIVAKLIHQETNLACLAERACLRVLEGGCSVPVGTETISSADTGTLKLTGTVTSLLGDKHVEITDEATVKTVEEAEKLGERVAKQLIGNGAKSILDEIGSAKEERLKKEQAVSEQSGSS